MQLRCFCGMRISYTELCTVNQATPDRFHILHGSFEFKGRGVCNLNIIYRQEWRILLNDLENTVDVRKCYSN